uniref:DNA ligase IV n=1 Tax=Syphacia muris TaxID=451379 RepID=A0A0N5AY72_9BILA
MVQAKNAEEAAKLFKFSTFCDLLDRIRRISKLAGSSKCFKQRAIKHLLTQWKNLFSSDVVPNYFPLLRLVANRYDTRKYHFKIKRLIQKICKALILPDATRNYLLELSEKSTSTAKVIEKLVKEISSRNTDTDTEFTLYELNESLEKVTDTELSETEIRLILKKCGSENEIFWILQILLRSVEECLAVSPAVIINCVHPHANQLRLSGTSLERICELTAENKLRDESSLLFRPFEPMLLSRVKSSSNECFVNVYDKRTKLVYYFQLVKYCGSPFYMQLKFDGEHFLLHRKSDGEYKFFSRNQIDHTDKVGPLMNEKLNQYFAPFVKDCIFDGELLLWDVFENKFVGKGRHASDGRVYDVKSLRDEGACIPCFAVFDLVYLNGRVLFDIPLSERLELLRTVLKKQESSVIFVGEFRVVSSREEFATFFKEAMLAHEEGVVVKRMDSLYKIGTRMMSNGCFKVKPFHLGNETLDVAVVGVDRAGDGHIQSYTVAVLREGKYSIIGKVGAGLDYNCKEQLRRYLTKDFGFLKGESALDWIHSDYCHNDLPTDFVHKKNLQVLEVIIKIAVELCFFLSSYERYANCLLLQIKAKGVVNNRLYSPVIKFHRLDKPVKDIDTYETFQEFDETLRNQSIAEAESHAPSERKRAAVVPEVMEDYRLSKRIKVENLGTDFEGLQFCVLRGSANISIQELRDIVVSFGGKCFANPTKNTQYVITGEPNHLKTKSVIKSNTCNVIHAQWLIDCKTAAAVLPLRKEYILNVVNSDLINKFGYDSWKEETADQIDSYEEKVTVGLSVVKKDIEPTKGSNTKKWSEEWIQFMLKKSVEPFKAINGDGFESLYGRLLGGDRYHFFDQKRFFMHVTLKEVIRKYMELLILIHGGTLVTVMSDSDFICVQKKNTDIANEEVRYNQHVVDVEWLQKEVNL